MNKTLAVIKTGGKQYLVREGEELQVEKLGKPAGTKVELPALLVWTGDKLYLDSGTVQAEILAEKKDRKIAIFKYKSKTRYRKTKGHRQKIVVIKIIKITA